MKRELLHDGIQVYFIGKREGAYARFLREQYQCEGRCKSNIYALTLVGADEAHVLHSVFKKDGGQAVEVELEEITRTDGLSRYQRGSAEDRIVEYLRSIF